MSLSFLQFEETRSVGVMSGATITAPAASSDESDPSLGEGSGSKADEIPN